MLGIDPHSIIEIRKLSLRFGGLQVLHEIDLDVNAEEVLAVIGPNGAGKTSLFNCINGFYHPYEGEIIYEGKDLTRLKPHKIAEMGIARTFQNIELFSGLTALENLMAARHILMRRGALAGSLFFGPAKSEEIAHRGQVEEIIDLLEMESIRKKVVASLPYGQRKRVDLARALCMEPSVLLLDEPMAGMNVEEKEDMARFVLDIHELKKIPIVLVEHDMDVVMDICSRVAVLDFGIKIAEGRPSEIRADKRVIKAYLGED
ncbi:MAG: ABC transporter ATP-binding protein [Deltaproteobacteria bacterium CG_4_8_14_3_um_filter_51_11]|nr:MAG: ABC transporter ATP-binding protein [Deltaproteobacteria bacterium CG23_combo_of_CG06-09_8_20_14_all_51_20]PIW01146.1 MAG: ABC transporter ATP-binding protein [Deltaproteobacteria bacterium CG17_big_fil_post_rev_8_21_14_2_50_51_6]PIX19088.1 MAG: ABC transporter ATP-binding protein [Deltaproteobacteria bacterium CG_4_8_14_3_um_filter_51_11]